MKAILRGIRISPKKANLVAGIVRNKKATEALNILKFMPKKGANILYRVLQSAMANAKNNFKQDVDDLYISQILVTKGMTFKRSIPISRGRTHPILKRSSHITVELSATPKDTGKTDQKSLKTKKTENKKTDTEQ